jgi:hypothetical protein
LNTGICLIASWPQPKSWNSYAKRTLRQNRKNVANEILVEFVPDFTKLQAGVTSLSESGVLSKDMAEAFGKAQKAVDETSDRLKSQKKWLDDLDKGVKNAGKSWVDSFRKQAGDALRFAAEEERKLRKETDDTGKSTVSLRQRIKELRAALAEMKLAGQENTEQYKAMRTEAAKLVDTMGDVSRETRELASDSQRIDTAVNAVHGLTSAYQIAAGASALLGGENEQLQATLVKLNALMAITSGLQQLQNLLQKEGNLVRLVTIGQTRLQAVVTNLQTAAQGRNIIVTNLATVSMRVLNAVMRANPVLLLVGAFAALAGAMTLFGGSSKKSADAVEELTAKMDALNASRDKLMEDISISTTEDIARLKAVGASEDQLTQRRMDGLKAEKELNDQVVADRLRTLKAVDTFMFKDIKSIEDAQRELQKTNDRLIEEADNNWLKRRKPLLEALVEDLKKQRKLESDILVGGFEFEESHRQDDLKNAKEFADAKVLIVKEGTQQEIEAKKAAVRAQLALELDNANLLAGERSRIIADANKKIAELNKQGRLLELENNRSDINAKLALEKEGTEEFLKLQVDALTVQAKIDVENAKDNAHKKEEIWATYLKNVDKLTKEFQNNADKKSIQTVIDTLNARLQLITLGAQEELNLTIAKLNAERALELSAVENNKEKEKEINARFDRQINDARLAALEKELERELALEAAMSGRRRRQAERDADNVNLPFEKRKKAILEIERINLESIDKQVKSVQQQYDDELISAEQFNLKYQELSDKRAEIEETTAEKIKGINGEAFADVIAKAQQVFDVFSGISQLISDQENSHIQSQRSRLQELRDSGFITDKEFQERQKRLDLAERRAKREQAQREKSLALFSATINAAEQIIKSLDNPFKLAFVLAMTAAQIALIASKPIPAFGKGTKSAPRGLAEVGETGTEIIQTKKGYYIADHPQVIWMKGGERIYNPKETEYIFNTITPNVKHDVINEKYDGAPVQQIDINKLSKSLGAEIAKHPRAMINLDQYGFSTYVLEQGSKTKYLNKRFTFNA